MPCADNFLCLVFNAAGRFLASAHSKDEKPSYDEVYNLDLYYLWLPASKMLLRQCDVHK